MAIPRIQGRASWIFTEDNFDVDQIVGVKNIKITDIQELAALAMKSYDPDFASVVQKGDVVIGGDNFGYGHPHYPPLKALRHLGSITGEITADDLLGSIFSSFCIGK